MEDIKEPLALERKHFDEALCMIEDDTIKFGLQLIEKFCLTGSEVTALEARDCLFKERAIRLKIQNGELKIDMGEHETWLRDEIGKRGLSGSDKLVPASPRLLATALRVALWEAGYKQYVNPYHTLQLLRNLK